MDGLELDGSALIVGRTILGSPSPVMPSLVFSRTCQIFTLYSLLVLRLRLCNPYFRTQGISNVQLSSAPCICSDRPKRGHHLLSCNPEDADTDRWMGRWEWERSLHLSLALICRHSPSHKQAPQNKRN